MTNIVITTTTNSIKVDFNDLVFFDERDDKNYKKGTWAKRDIADIKLALDDSFVAVQENDGHTWYVSFNGAGETFQVDTVSSVAPTSNSDLYDKLVALIA